MTLFHENNCDNVTLDCLTRVPIQYHRTDAFTSRGLDFILWSEIIFKRRSEEGLKELMVYICLGDNNSTKPTHSSWFCSEKKPEKTTILSGSGWWITLVWWWSWWMEKCYRRRRNVSANIFDFRVKRFPLSVVDSGATQVVFTLWCSIVFIKVLVLSYIVCCTNVDQQ